MLPVTKLALSNPALFPVCALLVTPQPFFNCLVTVWLFPPPQSHQNRGFCRSLCSRIVASEVTNFDDCWWSCCCKRSVLASSQATIPLTKLAVKSLQPLADIWHNFTEKFAGFLTDSPESGFKPSWLIWCWMPYFGLSTLGMEIRCALSYVSWGLAVIPDVKKLSWDSFSCSFFHFSNNLLEMVGGKSLVLILLRLNLDFCIE